jgi:chromosome segregation ATPase
MDDKKQRIRELEKEYLKLSRKEAGLVRQQQNYLIDTTKERKKLNAIMEKIEDELSELKKNLINYPVEIKILNTNTATTAIHEVNLIDFKCKKVIKTTSIAELNNKIQQLLQEEGKKLEEKGLLPKPTPPMFYINYAKKTLTMNFYYEKQ